MSIVCLWSPGWSTGAGLGADLAAVLPAVLAEVAPRVCIEAERVWVDGRGLPGWALAESLLERLAAVGVEDARAGVGGTGVVARMGARGGRGARGGSRFDLEPSAAGAERDLEPEAADEPEPEPGPDHRPASGSVSVPGGSRARVGTGSGRGPGPDRGPGRGLGLVADEPPGAGTGRGHEIGPANGRARDRARARDREGSPTEPEIENEIENEIETAPLRPPWLSRITVIPPGRERAFLAPLPLGWLGVDERVLALLEGVGVRTCGELAELEREAVEVRFGVEGVVVWRLARGEDRRRLFPPVPPERPNASLEFLGYEVTDPERLVFTANALLGSVCDRLRERGEHARRIRLTLSLGNGETWEKLLRPARATASRAVWLRLVRGALERLTVPDAVAGMALEVESSEAAAVRQGDLFDRGFATASAVEAAMLRLLESQGEVVVRPEVGRHPLVERRTRWVAEGVEGGAAFAGADPASGGGEARRGRASSGHREALPPGPVALPISSSPDRTPTAWDTRDAGLSLRLLPEPRGVRVETGRRRGSVVPVRYRDGAGWSEVVTAAGPDRISGGQWEAAYAREYYRAVTGEGVMVWLFRDAMKDEWYVHGWWD